MQKVVLILNILAWHVFMYILLTCLGENPLFIEKLYDKNVSQLIKLKKHGYFNGIFFLYWLFSTNLCDKFRCGCINVTYWLLVITVYFDYV